jgi:predicted nucleic acid-binding protein
LEAAHTVALDTSCLIALVCGWHEHHVATRSLVEQRLDHGAVLAVAAPALVEAYAVLTRLPAPHRLAPPDALQLLHSNFHDHARTVALSARDYWSLLSGAPAAGIHGGRTYDAVIAACARTARARELLTLNVRHFESFADDSLKITSPISPP